MKRLFSLICTFTAICAAITSCSKDLEGIQSKAPFTDIKVEFSATMPEFKSGEILDTKASMESVVRIRWTKNDRLAVINLSTKKVLGGCMIADNNGINTTFSSLNLVGTIHTGDKFVFILDNQSTIAGATEKDFEPFTIDISSQEGNSDNVPIVVYAEYTATKDNEIEAVNLDFNYLVSYVQLAVAALPARTTITEISIDNIGNSCDFDITGSGTFKVQPKKGSITLTEDFSADGKGAKVRYFSCFESPAQSSAREAHISANGALHSTSWLKAGLSIGYYYQSVATGFTNENIQFVDEAFKSYCVSHYDLNGDGELSFAEAAAVTDYVAFNASEKSSIKNVYELPYFPTELGLPIFSGCTALSQIIIPGTVTSIPAHAFENCISLTDISLPSGIISIGENAFKGCVNLKSFHGDLATADNRFLIKDGHLMAFAPAELTEISLSTGITNIDDGVFDGCSKITSIVFPQTLQTIGKKSFANCSKISVIRLPENVTSVGDNAFEGCTSLRSLFCDALFPPFVGSKAFEKCSAEFHVSVSSSSEETYKNSDWNQYNVSSAQPFNEIWYTTTDKQTFNYGSPSYFGATGVISNVYVGDQGILIFDGDITKVEMPSYLYGRANLKSISLPESTVSIGDGAFYGCSNLQTINPGFVLSIGKQAFYNCSKLESFSCSTVTSIGQEAFAACSNMVSLSVPNIESIGMGMCASCTKLVTVNLGIKNKTAGERCFYSCKALESFSFAGFSTIPAYCLSSCIKINRVTIPASVKRIENTALPSNIAIYIDDLSNWCTMEKVNPSKYSLYYNDNLLDNLIVPNDVTSIADKAFYGAISIGSITIGDNVQTIGANALDCGASSIHIGANVTSGDIVINDGMSVYVKDIKQWCKLHTGVDYLTSDAVRYYNLYLNNNLVTHLIIPDDVETINDYCFQGINSITSVSLGNDVRHIGTGAFKYCSMLTNAELNNGLESIGDNAFYGCIRITSVNIPNTIINIGAGAFRGTEIGGDLVLPQSLSTLGSSAFTATNIKSVTLQSPVPELRYTFSQCPELETVSLPEGQQSIGYGAFSYCSKLSSIIIPSTIETILDDAFANCSNLASINLPEGLKTIGKRAFYSCSSYNFTSLTIPSTVTLLSNQFLLNAAAIKYIYCKATIPPTLPSGSIDIPGGLIKIYIPSGSMSTYTANTDWSKYSSYFEEMEF